MVMGQGYFSQKSGAKLRIFGSYKKEKKLSFVAPT